METVGTGHFFSGYGVQLKEPEDEATIKYIKRSVIKFDYSIINLFYWPRHS